MTKEEINKFFKSKIKSITYNPDRTITLDSEGEDIMTIDLNKVDKETQDYFLIELKEKLEKI